MNRQSLNLRLQKNEIILANYTKPQQNLYSEFLFRSQSIFEHDQFTTTTATTTLVQPSLEIT